MRFALESCTTTEEQNYENQNVDPDVDVKIKELLKFQHNMIEKLEEVIKKLDKIHL